jgi:predicted chitinase
MTTQESIFDFADKFNIKSPFGHWIQTNGKELSIKYNSAVLINTEYQINISITANNLKTKKANLSLFEEEVIFDETVKTVPLIISSPKSNYTLKFDKKLLDELSDTILEQDFEFFISISCDGLEAKTKTFKLPQKATTLSEPKKQEIKKEKATCYCNRDFTIEEFKNTIVALRKKNGYKKLADVLFDIEVTEKIQNATFDDFAKFINSIFTKYSINTCIRKIHFLAQTYHESTAFRKTFEGRSEVPDNYKGGIAFQGRGIKQITHDYNYLEYYDYVKGTKFFKDTYIKNRKFYKNPKSGKNEIEGVTQYMQRVLDPDFGTKFLDKLKDFAPRLATEMHTACDSAGWFWYSKNLNQLADKDNVVEVSRKINGGNEGLELRKKYTKQLKEILKYDTCVSKS